MPRLLLAAVGAAGLLGAACGNSTTAPSAPINLTGTWDGLLGEAGTGTSLRMLWVATQTGQTVSGRASLVKPIADAPAFGTLSGTLTGNTLSWGYTAPAGSVRDFPACSISGTGSATAANAVISGTLVITPLQCAGSGLERPSSNQLTLTK
jgi:hypothetical protein